MNLQERASGFLRTVIGTTCYLHAKEVRYAQQLTLGNIYVEGGQGTATKQPFWGLSNDQTPVCSSGSVKLCDAIMSSAVAIQQQAGFNHT